MPGRIVGKRRRLHPKGAPASVHPDYLAGPLSPRVPRVDGPVVAARLGDTTRASPQVGEVLTIIRTRAGRRKGMGQAFRAMRPGPRRCDVDTVTEQLLRSDSCPSDSCPSDSWAERDDEVCCSFSPGPSAQPVLFGCRRRELPGSRRCRGGLRRRTARRPVTRPCAFAAAGGAQAGHGVSGAG